MSEVLGTPRGTYDVLPEESVKWQYLEEKIREWCKRYRISEVRTPIFEYTELFQRGVGDTTDIVQKEMFTFSIQNKANQDKQDLKSFTLRPEGTASTVRAFVAHKMYALPQPVKLYYMGPMFRYERPQAGRNRQFTQFGIEFFGTDQPSIDAEVISFANHLFADLGLKNIRLEINSVGCPVCRQAHKEAMIAHLTPLRGDLCEDCNQRLERNPLRVLDCKNKQCQEVTKDTPLLIDCLCDTCKDHFEQVKQHLTVMNIPFHINPRLVRGLDYYTQTAFEFMEDSIGAMSTICGGGRYNRLVEELGGQDTPGIGFAIGLERLLLAMEKQQVEIPGEQGIDVYAIVLDDAADVVVTELMYAMRQAGLCCERDFLKRSMKAQMKNANRLGAKYALIIGESELEAKQAQIKNMQTGEQAAVDFANIAEYLTGGN